MTRDEAIAKLKQTIAADLNLEGLSPDAIEADAPLFGQEGLGLDSLDAVELVVLVEKHFGVGITDAEEARAAFASVSVLADFILDRQGAAGA